MMDVLLEVAEPVTAGAGRDREYREIAVTLIDRNPAQPRTSFPRESLAELAESIKVHGVIQPVEVEETADGRYMLHHGERRWRAAKMAGLETIPAIVAPPRDAETALVRGLLENLYREDLNPIDEARVYRELAGAGWTRMRIARETGRSQATITGRLAWLEMEPEIQAHVAAGRLPVTGLAEALRGLPPEVRVPLADKLARQAAGLRGCLAAVERVKEILAEREKARAAAGREAPRHLMPMLRYAPAGNGAGDPAQEPARSVYDAAVAMCRDCYIRPRGDVIPSWTLVEEAAAATCEACQKRDGPAIPDVCRNCPGVTMVKALLAKTGAGT